MSSGAGPCEDEVVWVWVFGGSVVGVFCVVVDAGFSGVVSVGVDVVMVVSARSEDAGAPVASGADWLLQATSRERVARVVRGRSFMHPRVRRGLSEAREKLSE
jgi:hypothetical protein